MRWFIIPSKSQSSLSLVASEDGILVINGLRIEAEASTVALGDESVALRNSSMLLRNIMLPRSQGGYYAVARGEASFVVTITVDGNNRTVDWVNAEPICLREYPTGEWEFEPFDATYTDTESGTWTLRTDRMLFRPSR